MSGIVIAVFFAKDEQKASRALAEHFASSGFGGDDRFIVSILSSVKERHPQAFIKEAVAEEAGKMAEQMLTAREKKRLRRTCGKN